MYVIAGVSGHVGSVAANQLLEKGKKVKVIVREAKKGVAWSKRGAEVAVGELQDRAFLTTALKGATGFFTLLPPKYDAPDFFAFQKQTADVIAGAVKDAGVPHVVLLSSVGADLPAGTGPIKGLHYAENALRKTGTTLSAIRAGYFQENVANSLVPARQASIFPSLLDPDYAFPQIATPDIGKLVAESLLSPPAKSEVVDLVGPLYSQRQVAEKLGKALGKPLNVITVPREGWVPGLVQAGFSKDLAELFAEMNDAFAKGLVSPKGDRTVQGTTPFEDTLPRVLG
jgi:uncharacterized protein YbjT (DUF2867 family)